MIYGTQDGWFPPIPGPCPVVLVAYILVLHVYVQYPQLQPMFGVFICE